MEEHKHFKSYDFANYFRPLTGSHCCLHSGNISVTLNLIEFSLSFQSSAILKRQNDETNANFRYVVNINIHRSTLAASGAVVDDVK